MESPKVSGLAGRFVRAGLASEREADHVTALRVAKLAGRLVKHTIKLVSSGRPSKTFFYPRLDTVDATSTTLALNAELRQADIAVTMEVARDWDGSVGDPGYNNRLSIASIDGKPIQELLPKPDK